MLSENQKKIQTIIETKLSGSDKDDALLFHVSVERKLTSVNLWFGLVKETLPDLELKYGTYSTESGSSVSLESTIIKLSAFIDAFFMSGKSVLDSFAHEIRNLYGFGGHSGKLCFDYALKLIKKCHQGTNLELYLTSLNIFSSEWYKDLNTYRRISTHESIIPIKTSAGLDFLSGQWRTEMCKLPDGRIFIDTGEIIKDELNKLIKESYDNILIDINTSKTKIIL